MRLVKCPARKHWTVSLDSAKEPLTFSWIVNPQKTSHLNYAVLKLNPYLVGIDIVND